MGKATAKAPDAPRGDYSVDSPFGLFRLWGVGGGTANYKIDNATCKSNLWHADPFFYNGVWFHRYPDANPVVDNTRIWVFQDQNTPNPVVGYYYNGQDIKKYGIAKFYPTELHPASKKALSQSDDLKWEDDA